MLKQITIKRAKKLFLTKHARQRLIAREIEDSTVCAVLKYGKATISSKGGLSYRFGKGSVSQAEISGVAPSTIQQARSVVVVTVGKKVVTAFRQHESINEIEDDPVGRVARVKQHSHGRRKQRRSIFRICHPTTRNNRRVWKYDLNRQLVNMQFSES